MNQSEILKAFREKIGQLCLKQIPADMLVRAERCGDNLLVHGSDKAGNAISVHITMWAPAA